MFKVFRFFLKSLLYTVILLLALPIILIAPLVQFDPPTTSLQIQRRISAVIDWRAYQKVSVWAELSEISPAFQRAVINSEDANFYSHRGIDFREAQKAYDDAKVGRRMRGASTITMQLCKNLYLWEGWTIYDKAVRKGIEVYLALWMETFLTKSRILEIYLNVIEWGDGIYGAEAAAMMHYGKSADDIGPREARRLARLLPSPRKRR